MVKLLQEEHDARKRIQGGTGANQYTSEQSGEILHSAKANKIRQEIATEHGITPGAVKAAVEIGRGIDKAFLFFAVFFDLTPPPLAISIPPPPGLWRGEKPPRRNPHRNPHGTQNMSKPTQKPTPQQHNRY